MNVCVSEKTLAGLEQPIISTSDLVVRREQIVRQVVGNCCDCDPRLNYMGGEKSPYGSYRFEHRWTQIDRINACGGRSKIRTGVSCPSIKRRHERRIHGAESIIGQADDCYPSSAKCTDELDGPTWNSALRILTLEALCIDQKSRHDPECSPSRCRSNNAVKSVIDLESDRVNADIVSTSSLTSSAIEWFESKNFCRTEFAA